MPGDAMSTRQDRMFSQRNLTEFLLYRTFVRQPPFPPVGEETESWQQLVTSFMRVRGLNQRKLAQEWGISTAVMSNWVSKGTRPSLENIIRIHEKSGLPLARMLAAADYIHLDDAISSPEYPAWLQEQLHGLSTAELSVVAETARGLHRLREETQGYEAARPSPTPRAGRPPRQRSPLRRSEQ